MWEHNKLEMVGARRIKEAKSSEMTIRGEQMEEQRLVRWYKGTYEGKCWRQGGGDWCGAVQLAVTQEEERGSTWNQDGPILQSERTKRCAITGKLVEAPCSLPAATRAHRDRRGWSAIAS